MIEPRSTPADHILIIPSTLHSGANKPFIGHSTCVCVCVDELLIIHIQYQLRIYYITISYPPPPPPPTTTTTTTTTIIHLESYKFPSVYFYLRPSRVFSLINNLNSLIILSLCMCSLSFSCSSHYYYPLYLLWLPVLS